MRRAFTYYLALVYKVRPVSFCLMKSLKGTKNLAFFFASFAPCPPNPDLSGEGGPLREILGYMDRL